MTMTQHSLSISVNTMSEEGLKRKADDVALAAPDVPAPAQPVEVVEGLGVVQNAEAPNVQPPPPVAGTR